MKLPTPTNSTPADALVEIAPEPAHEVSHAVPAADAAALSLVFLLVFCVVCFAWGAAILGRRERKVTRDHLGNPTDEAVYSCPESQGEAGPSRAEWERKSDWWKRRR